jgi:hypothetical protein
MSEVRDLVRNDRRLTIREIVEEVGLHDSHQTSVTEDSGTKPVSAKVVP